MQFEGQTFPNVKSLMISETRLSGPELAVVDQTFPNVETLGALTNGWTELGPFHGLFRNVVSLNLSENQLPWEELLFLGAYERLEVLKLIANPIGVITFPEGFIGFSSLRLLNIEETDIDSWLSVHALNTIGLRQLRLSSVPLQAKVCDKFRYFVIAYIQSLTYLNGGEISEIERKSAERAFLREYRDNDIGS
jgi:hypothetical protein